MQAAIVILKCRIAALAARHKQLAAAFALFSASESELLFMKRRVNKLRLLKNLWIISGDIPDSDQDFTWLQHPIPFVAEFAPIPDAQVELHSLLQTCFDYLANVSWLAGLGLAQLAQPAQARHFYLGLPSLSHFQAEAAAFFRQLKEHLEILRLQRDAASQDFESSSFLEESASLLLLNKDLQVVVEFLSALSIDDHADYALNTDYSLQALLQRYKHCAIDRSTLHALQSSRYTQKQKTQLIARLQIEKKRAEAHFLVNKLHGHLETLVQGDWTADKSDFVAGFSAKEWILFVSFFAAQDQKLWPDHLLPVLLTRLRRASIFCGEEMLRRFIWRVDTPIRSVTSASFQELLIKQLPAENPTTALHTLQVLWSKSPVEVVKKFSQAESWLNQNPTVSGSIALLQFLFETGWGKPQLSCEPLPQTKKELRELTVALFWVSGGHASVDFLRVKNFLLSIGRRSQATLLELMQVLLANQYQQYPSIRHAVQAWSDTEKVSESAAHKRLEMTVFLRFFLLYLDSKSQVQFFSPLFLASGEMVLSMQQLRGFFLALLAHCEEPLAFLNNCVLQSFELPDTQKLFILRMLFQNPMNHQSLEHEPSILQATRQDWVQKWRRANLSCLQQVIIQLLQVGVRQDDQSARCLAFALFWQPWGLPEYSLEDEYRWRQNLFIVWFADYFRQDHSAIYCLFGLRIRLGNIVGLDNHLFASICRRLDVDSQHHLFLSLLLDPLRRISQDMQVFVIFILLSLLQKSTSRGAIKSQLIKSRQLIDCYVFNGIATFYLLQKLQLACEIFLFVNHVGPLDGRFLFMTKKQALRSENKSHKYVGRVKKTVACVVELSGIFLQAALQHQIKPSVLQSRDHEESQPSSLRAKMSALRTARPRVLVTQDDMGLPFSQTRMGASGSNLRAVKQIYQDRLLAIWGKLGWQFLLHCLEKSFDQDPNFLLQLSRGNPTWLGFGLQRPQEKKNFFFGLSIAALEESAQYYKGNSEFCAKPAQLLVWLQQITNLLLQRQNAEISLKVNRWYCENLQQDQIILGVFQCIHDCRTTPSMALLRWIFTVFWNNSTEKDAVLIAATRSRAVKKMTTFACADKSHWMVAGYLLGLIVQKDKIQNIFLENAPEVVCDTAESESLDCVDDDAPLVLWRHFLQRHLPWVVEWFPLSLHLGIYLWVQLFPQEQLQALPMETLQKIQATLFQLLLNKQGLLSEKKLQRLMFLLLDLSLCGANRRDTLALTLMHGCELYAPRKINMVKGEMLWRMHYFCHVEIGAQDGSAVVEYPGFSMGTLIHLHNMQSCESEQQTAVHASDVILANIVLYLLFNVALVNTDCTKDWERLLGWWQILQDSTQLQLEKIKQIFQNIIDAMLDSNSYVGQLLETLRHTYMVEMSEISRSFRRALLDCYIACLIEDSLCLQIEPIECNLDATIGEVLACWIDQAIPELPTLFAVAGPIRELLADLQDKQLLLRESKQNMQPLYQQHLLETYQQVLGLRVRCHQLVQYAQQPTNAETVLPMILQEQFPQLFSQNLSDLVLMDAAHRTAVKKLIRTMGALPLQVLHEALLGHAVVLSAPIQTALLILLYDEVVSHYEKIKEQKPDVALTASLNRAGLFRAQNAINKVEVRDSFRQHLENEIAEQFIKLQQLNIFWGDYFGNVMMAALILPLCQQLQDQGWLLCFELHARIFALSVSQGYVLPRLKMQGYAPRESGIVSSSLDDLKSDLQVHEDETEDQPLLPKRGSNI